MLPAELLPLIPMAAWVIFGAVALARENLTKVKTPKDWKYDTPDAEYTHVTTLIRDARIHTIEAVEDRHTKMLDARKYLHKAEHLEWEIEAGGRPTQTWLLDPSRDPESTYQWDPEKHWVRVDMQDWRWRDEPEYSRKVAANQERAALEVVPQIENCAATVRTYQNHRDRPHLPKPPRPSAPTKTTATASTTRNPP